MQFSEEQIKKAIAAKTAEELFEMAKAENLSLTEEQAAHYFKVLHTDPADAECIEMSKEEQENVAGGSQCVGGKTYSSDPPYRLIVTAGNSCPAYQEFVRISRAAIKGTCWYCYHCETSGNTFTIPSYCSLRTIDNDPYR